MTTDRVRARRRPKQAPAARILATGAALTATGTLVAIMGAAAMPAAATLTAQPVTPAAAVLDRTAAPGTVVVVQPQAPTIASAASARPRAQAAQTTPGAGTRTAAPSAGQAVPAPPPQRQPAPVATSTGS